MSLTLLITLLVVGVVLLTLEIVVLPGGFAGIVGGILIAVSIWQSYALYGIVAGNIMLIASIAFCIFILIYMMKARTWKRFSLDEESDSKVNQIDENQLAIGSRGVTIARLAPTGKASFDGRLEEVHAINSFIDPGTPIEIVSIDGYRIDVKAIDNE